MSPEGLRPTVRDLAYTLNAEILQLLGASPRCWWHRFLEVIFWPLAERFSEVAAGFDQRVGQSGLREAANWVLPHFIRGLQVEGTERIPRSGPLLIASNHPGSIDSLAIAAHVPREDLRMVATGREFVRSLVATSRYLILTPREDLQGRMTVVRQAARHLRQGGALLLFPGGRVEPDPAVMPGALQAVERWSRSLEILLRAVPGTKLQLAAVSGVLSPRFLRNPLVRLRRGMSEKQVLAEMFQIMANLFHPPSVDLTPRLSFAQPVELAELMRSGGTRQMSSAVREYAQYALRAHLASISPRLSSGT